METFLRFIFLFGRYIQEIKFVIFIFFFKYVLSHKLTKCQHHSDLLINICHYSPRK